MADSKSIRRCSRCHQHLSLDQFAPKKDGKHARYCRPCDKQYKAEYYKKNSARLIAKTAAWRIANPEKYKESNKTNYAANRARHMAKWAEWCVANRERRNAYTNEWRANNLDRQREAEARYRARNRDDCNQRISAWKSKNLDKLRLYTLVRGRTQRQSTPGWADKAAIRAIYRQAAALRASGDDWHVDHIVPLIHPLVCGFHCAANLQIVPASENIQKGNKWWPDMPS